MFRNLMSRLKDMHQEIHEMDETASDCIHHQKYLEKGDKFRFYFQ